MAFYGNITNTSQTTFQFDRIYSNRLEMDVACANDSIFVGRYVLVEYDKETAFPVAYEKNGKFYSSKPGVSAVAEISYLGNEKRPAPSFPYETKNGIYKDEIIQIQETKIDPKTKIETIIGVTFYKCIGGNSDGKAVFEKIDKTTSTNSYINNFSLDEASYAPNSKDFKGFDSTVWIKTTVDSNGQLITKYVHIADLNSVVPTFDVAADAPTMSPLPPHFDADSTNVYYKLHVQAPYGLRVKAKINDIPSDANTYWTRETYDVKTGKTTKQYYNANSKDWVNYTNESEIKKFAADIYYNKAAFAPQVGNTTINKHAKTSIENKINILPTGESGQTYYDHSSKTYKKANDVQEISIHLPAIGDMMSDAWDVIHGENRDDARTDVNDSLQGRLDSFKDMKTNQVAVKRYSDGTMVGSKINNAIPYTLPVGKDILSANNVPAKFKGDDPWIETVIDTSTLVGEAGKDQTNNSGISIRHTFHEVKDSTSEFNKNTHEFTTDDSFQDDKILVTNKEAGKEDYDTIKLYTPYVDAMGHVVGKNIETVTLPYSYKTIKTNGREDKKEDINTDAVDVSSIVADNTQDTLAINSGNKWIRIDTSDEENEDILTISHDVHNFSLGSNGHTNLNKETGATVENNLNIPDWEYDKAGHITGKHDHKYTLPFSFKTIKISNSERENAPGIADGTQIADTTQDTLTVTTSNRWIRLDGDTEDTIIIGHDIKTPTLDDTHTQTLSSDKEITTFKIYDDSFDEAGHFKHRDTTTVTMPTGYNTITGDSGSTTASATADTLAITANDVWLQTEVTTDKVNITHTGPASGTKRNEANKTPQFGDTFTIEDWSFDSKGHKNELSTHTVTIPKGSLNNLTATTSSVITGLSMNAETGAINQTNNDVGKLALTGYDSATAGQTAVGSGDSINTAIGKLQNQITNEKKRINTILTGEDDLDDTINTFKELQEYIATHGEEAADIVKNINNEISRAQGAETALSTRIDNLDYEKGETENYYISSIKQVDGKIEAFNKQIPIRTVTTGSSNGTISVNNSDVKVKGLGSAAYTASTAYATAVQGGKADSAVQETTKFKYDTTNKTKTIQDLMTIVYNQATKISELEQRIATLEDSTTGK